MTPEVAPLPAQLRTRTGISDTAFATPYVEPPTVPATCEPWPWQSPEPYESEIAVKPAPTRPPKSLWVGKMPVSMM